MMTLHEISVLLVAVGVIAVGGAAVIHFKLRNIHPAHAYYSNMMLVMGFTSLAMGFLIEILR